MMLEYSPRSHPIQVSICLGTHREPALRRIRSQASTFRDRQLLQISHLFPVEGVLWDIDPALGLRREVDL